MQSTFNTWNTNTRTWQKKERAIIINQPVKRWGRLTIFGAISKDLVKPVFQMSPRTSKEETLEFLQLVRQHLSRDCKPWLLYDQHYAHRSRPVQAYIQEHFRPLMQPKQSCGKCKLLENFSTHLL